MFENGRKTIGVIICDVVSHYQEQICHTLSDYAEREGYNLAFFTFFTCYGGTETQNGRGEANLVYLIPFEQLDAVILCQDTLLDEGPLAYVWESIAEKCDCPVVTLRQDSGKYPCVLVDSNHCMEQMVYHFIDEHHFTKFGFMSGPLEHPDSICRLEDFKRALKNRNIPFDDSMVFEGDFWNQKGKEAANYFTMELKECPEAIICANDYMATVLINELVSKGFMVPEDIAVSGFDNIWEASITMPPITTVAVPVADMAKKAIQKIEKMWAGEEDERVTTVDAQLIVRNSCGCKTFNMQSMLVKRVRQVKEYQKILDSNQINTYMFIGLSDLDSLDDIDDHFRLQELFDDHVESFFLCLGEGRGASYPKYRSDKNGYAKRSKAIGGIFHKRPFSADSFPTSNLLPKEVSEDKPMIYYFFPLHNNQYSFGYLAVSFDGTYSVNKAFHNSLAIVGNALEMIRIKQKNQGLLSELNNLYVHDSLTGLYNRRGFDTKSEEFYSRAKKEKKNLVILAIDMDNLKVVNDRFGHMNGDLALKTIGSAMRAISKNEDICARVGGDEYNIVGLGYSEEEVRNIADKFEQYLDEFNLASDLPYLVKASVGYSIIEAGQECSLEDCINRADDSLYENKRKRKENKQDTVLRQDD